MNHGKLFLLTCLLVGLCGCGHNVYLEREITGLGIIVPVGDSALGVTIGSVKTVTATVRGGTSLETTSSSGGGIFSGSGAESRITTFKTNQQLNEANLKEVLISPEVPEAVKVVIATNMAAAAKAPKFMPAILQTDSATVHMGAESVQSNAVEQIQHHSSGVDKIIETVPQIVAPVISTVTDVTDKTIGGVKDTVDKTIDRTFDWSIATKWTVIVSSICAVLIVLFKKDKGSATVPELPSIDPDGKKTSEEVPNGNSSSDSTPSPSQPEKEPAIPNKKQEEQYKAPTLKGKKWWQKIFIIISSIIALIGKVPPETRAKVINLVKDWIVRKRAEKAKKKSSK